METICGYVSAGAGSLLYETDRRWSDTYVHDVKRIVGTYLLRESTEYVDRNHAADLIVQPCRTVAVRLRRSGFANRFGAQITMRSRRPTNVKTELSKVLDGYGDWMFYGHVDGGSIAPWHIIDLDALRVGWPDKWRWGEVENKDGTAFVWIDVDPRFVIAQEAQKKAIGWP